MKDIEMVITNANKMQYILKLIDKLVKCGAKKRETEEIIDTITSDGPRFLGDAKLRDKLFEEVLPTEIYLTFLNNE